MKESFLYSTIQHSSRAAPGHEKVPTLSFTQGLEVPNVNPRLENALA